MCEYLNVYVREPVCPLPWVSLLLVLYAYVYVCVYMCMPAWQLRCSLQAVWLKVLLFTPEELHAEVCYAECLLQRAALTFLQVRMAYPESLLLNLLPLTILYLFKLIICLFSFSYLSCSLFRMKTWSVSSKEESKWGTATRHTSENLKSKVSLFSSHHACVIPSFQLDLLSTFFFNFFYLPRKTALICVLYLYLTESFTQSSSPLDTVMVTTMAILRVVWNWE